MEYILDTNKKETSQIKSKVIYTIQRALKEKKLTKISIAMAFAFSSEINSSVTEFWDVIIKEKIPTDFYFRLDAGLPIDIEILKLTQTADHIHWFPILRDFHTKILWSAPLGVYIGSANMTDKAWNSNFEAGVWITEDIPTDELEGYFEELALVAIKADKQEILQCYQQYSEDVSSLIKDNDLKKEEIFQKIFPASKIPVSSSKPTPFMDDIEKIYSIFFDEIYPQINDSRHLLPEEWKNYPTNYIADQILVAVERDHHSSLDAAIKNIKNSQLYPEGFTQTFEGYLKNYDIIQKIKKDETYTIKDKLYEFLSNIHAVTSDHYADLNTLVRSLTTGKSFCNKDITDIIRFLVQEDIPIIEKYDTALSSADWKINGLAKGRIGEIIGIAQISYKGKICPILNRGVRARLILLGYNISKDWIY